MIGKHVARRCGEGEITTFDYGLPAELFMLKRKGRTRQRVGYRRFATAAEAIGLPFPAPFLLHWARMEKSIS